MDRRSTLLLALGLSAAPAAAAAQPQRADPGRVVDILDFAPTGALAAIREGISRVDLSVAFYAALQALPSPGGGRIRFGSTGQFYFARPLSWDDKPVILEGCGASVQPGAGTVLKFAPGVGGLTVQNGLRGFGSGSEITQLVIDGSDRRAPGAADGLRIQGNGVRVRDVVVRNFSGHGVHVLSAFPTAVVALNANNWSLDAVRSIDNGKSGLATYGVDSNAGSHRDCDFSGNREYGWDENAFLGNAGYSPHFAGNGMGAMHFNAISRHAQVYGAYVEDDKTPALTIHKSSAGGHVAFFGLVTNPVVDETPERNSLIFRKDGGPHFNRLAVGGPGSTDVIVEPTLVQLLKGAILRLANRASTVNWNVQVQGSDLTLGSPQQGAAVRLANRMILTAPTFANNAAARAGGLVEGTLYKTPTGELRIVV